VSVPDSQSNGRASSSRIALQATAVDRNLDMRIGRDEAMSRKVLAAIAHAHLQHAVHRALGQQCHHARVAVKAAVADDAAAAVVEIEHRRKAEVDARGAQLGGKHLARRRCGLGGAHGVAHPQLAQRTHRRQAREAVGAKPLHATAFMIDADQQIGRIALNSALSAVICARSRQLRAKWMTPPTRGLAMRRRSASLSSVPATSTISGA
jgi:hypothetical protein